MMHTMTLMIIQISTQMCLFWSLGSNLLPTLKLGLYTPEFGLSEMLRIAFSKSENKKMFTRSR